MCDPAERADIPTGAAAQIRQKDYGEKALATSEPTLRDRLEQKRNRLTRQLVLVEEALRLIYADPNAEKIYDVLRRPAGF